MKHLKNYNELDILDDLRDILLDINDLGFYTHVGDNKQLITITISRLQGTLLEIKDFFNNEEDLLIVKESLNHIKEYAKLNGYLIDSTWLARLNNLSFQSKTSEGRKTWTDFNLLMKVNRYTIYITMFPKHR